MTRSITHVIGAAQAGLRLDRVVGDLLGLGRQRIRELFEARQVLLDGRRAHKGAIAVAGHTLTIRVPPEDRAFAQPELSLDIRFECEDYVIVNKPPGQASVAHRGADRDTLANALVGRFTELASIGHCALESGLVHRLDAGTSGLLVAARTARAFERLSAALKRSEWTKRYLAIIDEPLPAPAGEISGFLAPARHSSKRVQFTPTPPRNGSAYAASCTWNVRERCQSLTLVEIESSKAYRHQVRVLLAALGCPLVGDQLYGNHSTLLPEERHALHASFIAWPGDEEIRGFCIESPLPPDLATLLAPAPES